MSAAKRNESSWLLRLVRFPLFGASDETRKAFKKSAEIEGDSEVEADCPPRPCSSIVLRVDDDCFERARKILKCAGLVDGVGLSGCRGEWPRR